MTNQPLYRKDVLDKGFVELIDTLPSENMDLRIVQAARVSFNGELYGDDRDYRLLRYLIRNKEFGPLEHCKFSFRVKAPIMVARQWFRYRSASYSEQSLRYTEALEDDFYIPSIWRTQSKTNKQGSDGVLEEIENIEVSTMYDMNLTECYKAYKFALDSDVAREQARLFLPAFALYTTFLVTHDLRNLLHFIDERVDEHAQFEIRQYALAIKEIASQVAPKTMEYVYGQNA